MDGVKIPFIYYAVWRVYAQGKSNRVFVPHLLIYDKIILIN